MELSSLGKRKLSQYFAYYLIAYLALGSSFFVTPVFAATGVPQILAYQGRLTDPSGALLGTASGTTYYFKFSIWDTASTSTGSRLWPATAPASTSVTVTSGVFNVNIGDTGAGYPDALTYNFQDNANVYLQLEISPTPNGTYEVLGPRQRITSAGFAINAGTVQGFTPSQNASGSNIPVLNSGNLLLAGTNPQINATGTNLLVLQGGTGTGDIQFFSSANKITSGGNLTIAGVLSAPSVSFTNATGTGSLQTASFVATASSTLVGNTIIGANNTPSSTLHVVGTLTVTATTTVQGKLVDASGFAYVTSTTSGVASVDGIIGAVLFAASGPGLSVASSSQTVTYTFSSSSLGLGTASVQNIGAFLQTSNNLSDIVSTSTARTNLGLGDIATLASSTFLKVANNLSDLTNTSTARTSLGLGDSATLASSTWLKVTNNLSDLNNTSTARTNLGLGDSATLASSTFLKTANNGSDINNTSTFRLNLGLGDIATLASSTFLKVSNNLSDLTNTSTARTNLGLGDSATLASSTFLKTANNLSDLTNTSTARTNLGLGDSATLASSTFLKVANNLSDLNNSSTARANLGVSTGTVGTTTAVTTGYVPTWGSATGLTGTSTIFVSSTDVGIGTSTPIAKLHVNAGGANQPGVFVGDGLQAAPTTDLGAGFKALLTLGLKDDNGAAQLGFVTESLGKIATFQSFGNSLNFDHLTSGGSVMGNNYLVSYGGYAFSGATTPWYNGLYQYNDNTTAIGRISEWTTSTLNQTPYISFNNASSAVGIGTISPSSTLHVIAANTSTITSIFQATSTQTVDLTQWRSSSSAVLSAVDSTGRFGIGTPFPSSTLHVIGSFQVSGTSTLQGPTTIDDLSLGATTFPADSGVVSWIDMPVTASSSSGTVESYIAQLDGNALLTIYSESDGAGGIQNKRVGIGTSSPATLFTVATSSNIFNVTSAGKVGIGTSTPSTTLHVLGDVLVTATTTIQGKLVDASGNAYSTSSALGTVTTSTAVTAGYFPFWGSASALSGTSTIFASGTSIGIGTVSPSSTLHVVGTSQFSATSTFQGNVGVGTTSPATLFSVATSTNIFNVTSAGRVGIGTSTPLGLLHVANGSANVALGPHSSADDLVVEGNADNGISILTPDLNQGALMFGSASDNYGAGLIWNQSGGVFNVGTAMAGGQLALRSADQVEAVRIDANGNVGIKTTSPSSSLHVISAATSTITSIFQATSTQTVDLTQWRSSSSAVLSAVDSTGRFGIGTPFPSSTLHVVGDLIVTATSTIRGKLIDASGNAYSTSSALGTVTTSTAVTAGYFPFWGSATGLSGTSTIFSSTTATGANVGIGTISPSTTLHVVGTFQVSATSTLGGEVLLGSTDTGIARNAGGVVEVNSGVPGTLRDIKFRNLISTAGTGSSIEGGAISFWNTGQTTRYAYFSSAGTPNLDFSSGYQLLWSSSASDATSAADLGIGRNAANVMEINTGSAGSFGDLKVRQVIGSATSTFAGKVGIGTTAPSTTLHVVGVNSSTISIASTVTGGRRYDFRVGSVAGATSTFDIYDNASATSRLAIDSLGNVGIGTTAPSTTLHVVGTATISATTTIQGKLVDASGNAYSTSSALGTVTTSTAVTTGYFPFWGSATGLSGTSTIFSSSTGAGTANVGIGTISPSTTLHVVGDSRFSATSTFLGNVGIGTSSPAFPLSVSNNGSGQSAYFTRGVGVGTAPSSNTDIPLEVMGEFSTNVLIASPDSSANATMNFQHGIGGTVGSLQATANTQDFTISSAIADIVLSPTVGFGVGIGTAITSSTLHVVSRATSTITSIFQAASTQTVDLTQWRSSSSAVLAVVDSTGKVGVGTASPSSTLHVIGDFTVSGTSTLQGYTSISDLALGAMSFDPDAGMLTWTDLPVSTAVATNTVEAYTARLDGNPMLTIYGQADGSGGTKNRGVGIGTDAPSTTLHVVGANSSTISIANTVTGGRRFDLRVGSIAGATSTFDIFDNASSASRFAINSSGNVGIGTTAPSSTLHVVGGFQVSSSIFYVSSTSGFVGVGTTAPSSTLHVVGGVTIGNGANASSGLTLKAGTGQGANNLLKAIAENGNTVLQLTGNGNGFLGTIAFKVTDAPAGELTPSSASYYGDWSYGGLNIGQGLPLAFYNAGGTIDAGVARLTTSTLKITNGSTGLGGLSASSIIIGSTSTPSSTLHVIGDFTVSGTSTLQGPTTIADLTLGGSTFDNDAGQVTWADLPVTTAAATNTVESYTAAIDGNPLLTVYAQADGSGGTQNRAVLIATSSQSATTSIFYIATSTTIFQVRPTGGIVVGTPTGDDKGYGTINAQAVYDDNTLLTDWVFDAYYDGTMNASDSLLHIGYTTTTIDEMIAYTKAQRHLPTITGRADWNARGGLSLGALSSQLWETVETQALYIGQLNDRLKVLEGTGTSTIQGAINGGTQISPDAVLTVKSLTISGDLTVGGVTTLTTVIADTINAKKLCLDDICITKDELKMLLERSGITPAAGQVAGASTTTSGASSTPDTTATSTPDVTATSTASSTPDTTASSTPDLTATSTTSSTPDTTASSTPPDATPPPTDTTSSSTPPVTP